MSNAQADYQSLIAELKQIALLRSVSSVLGWDERTCMPAGGATLRSQQSSMLARMIHERITAPVIGDLLSSIEGSELVKDSASDAAVNVRQTRRQYQRAIRLPAALVEELARTEVLAEQAWAESRAKNDFASFQPWLEKMLVLKRRQAECLRLGNSAYDALLDEFEPLETLANLRRVFESLRQPLIELVAKIVDSGRAAPVEILEREYPAAAQAELARQAAAAVGFDFKSGRLDVSVHPFSTGIGPGDSRITTRYDERYFGDAFFGVLHESGHAMYSQGLLAEHFGTPRGREVSLGIHESQSRLWENLVGRSKAFWEFFYPKAQAAFPAATRDVSLQSWYFAVNDVRPSLIRTESDEVTYNLHVLLRFELEQALLADDIRPADLPAAWNEKMKKYLGIIPPDDTRGCLQDIHWSGGAIGYFPTYTLGNLYAAQFFEQAKDEMPRLEENFARGDFSTLLGWLRKNIHSQGMKFTASELVKKITGRELSSEPLLNHLRKKSSELYGVA
ncbi:MAG: carboxypeptidase M32 [Planctomycetota bacterium]|nr:carboxypeptidase M32 [Planctomycetota bacterium]